MYEHLPQTNGARILPYVGFFLFASTAEEALTLRQHLFKLLNRLRLLRHRTKGFGTLAHVGHHMSDIDLDAASGYFYTPKGARRRRSGGGPGGGCARRPIGNPSPPRGGRWKPRSRARPGTVEG
jgi:hypothetical protein